MLSGSLQPSPPSPPPPRCGVCVGNASSVCSLRPCAACRIELQARPTSSASLLLTAVDDSVEAAASRAHACGPRPIVELLVQQPGSASWETLTQVGRHGEMLPLELGGMHCQAPAGCKLAARLRDRSLRNVSADVSNKLMITTPPPATVPPHSPGHRIELMLRPALPEPYELSAQALVSELISTLSDAHFVMRRERMHVAEVSTTGAFLMIDVIPEDIYAYLSGPDVPRILLRLAVRADEFNLTSRGHRLDPRFGLWRQATPKQDASIHVSLPAKRLWPHHTDPMSLPPRPPPPPKPPPPPSPPSIAHPITLRDGTQPPLLASPSRQGAALHSTVPLGSPSTVGSSFEGITDKTRGSAKNTQLSEAWTVSPGDSSRMPGLAITSPTSEAAVMPESVRRSYHTFPEAALLALLSSILLLVALRLRSIRRPGRGGHVLLQNIDLDLDAHTPANVTRRALACISSSADRVDVATPSSRGAHSSTLDDALSCSQGSCGSSSSMARFQNFWVD